MIRMKQSSTSNSLLTIVNEKEKIQQAPATSPGLIRAFPVSDQTESSPSVSRPGTFAFATSLVLLPFTTAASRAISPSWRRPRPN
ncbi:hypothetical protein DPMN_053782 [Dreissena polymorpha]|uniref:Uncharacterized protein n=1 Tax=Dreissena polymorpha TaxID=45954 RepID=A0A9D4CNQ2_DREPO|nr:hypothetical protein DPMN_053782 [Dreissena polymorpha]